MKQKWDEVTLDEKVERLRKALLILAVGLVVTAALVVTLILVVNSGDDEQPSSPQKTEQRIDPNVA